MEPGFRGNEPRKGIVHFGARGGEKGMGLMVGEIWQSPSNRAIALISERLAIHEAIAVVGMFGTDGSIFVGVLGTSMAKTLNGHTERVFSVAFSTDGKTLASGSSDRTIKLWDVATGQNTATLTGHTNEVTSVAFSPDGKTLASGSLDKTIKLWDVATRKNTATLNGHTDWVSSVAFSPDGKTLASGSWGWEKVNAVGRGHRQEHRYPQGAC